MNEQKPSGSFVLWQNTLCNPLADPISMTHSAWHDGYASAKAERKPLTDEEIVRLMVGEDRVQLLYAKPGDPYFSEFAEGAIRELVESGRAIERAHGIGEQHGS